MDFAKYISTPVGKTEADPLITTLKLTKGRLTGGFLYFPSGPAGVLHFYARMGVHQILPFNTDEDFRLDDCAMPFTLGIDLVEPPYSVDCVTWNDSALYAHALTICFSLEPHGSKRYDLETLISELQVRNG